MAIRTKPGVLFTVIAPGGFRIIAALDFASLGLGKDLVITSACDGVHPAGGLNDPHYTGNAYDVRSHNFNEAEKALILERMVDFLGDDKFYMFLEGAGTSNEHIHVQVRNGQVYP